MLRLNVLSGTTVLTILGRRALRAAQLSPKIHSQPPKEHKTRYATPRHLQIGLDQPRKPLPRTRLNLLCFDGRLVTTAASSGRASNTETINSKIPKDELGATAMKNPITPKGAASAQNPLPPVPTTKILAISHFMGTPMTPAQRAQMMPHEVHETVNAYLMGKIDQWYFRTDGKGVVFIVNASTPEEAKNILEKFPLGQAGLMGFDYIPLGPLSPLRIISDMVK